MNRRHSDPNINSIDAIGNYDRTPPHSIEDEACVLGSMILKSDCIHAVQRIVSASDFYRPAHVPLFNAVIALFERQDPVDLVSVRDELEARQDLENVGGMDYVVALAEGVPGAENAEYYATQVKGRSRLRNLLAFGTCVAEHAYRPGMSADDLLEMAETMLLDIESSGGGDEKLNLLPAFRRARRQRPGGALRRHGPADGLPETRRHSRRPAAGPTDCPGGRHVGRKEQSGRADRAECSPRR